MTAAEVVEQVSFWDAQFQTVLSARVLESK